MKIKLNANKILEFMAESDAVLFIGYLDRVEQLRIFGVVLTDGRITIDSHHRYVMYLTFGFFRRDRVVHIKF